MGPGGQTWPKSAVILPLTGFKVKGNVRGDSHTSPTYVCVCVHFCTLAQPRQTRMCSSASTSPLPSGSIHPLYFFPAPSVYSQEYFPQFSFLSLHLLSCVSPAEQDAKRTHKQTRRTEIGLHSIKKKKKKSPACALVCTLLHSGINRTQPQRETCTPGNLHLLLTQQHLVITLTPVHENEAGAHTRQPH